MKTKSKIISYIVIIGSILLIAGIGSLFVSLGMSWFNGLAQPSEFVPSFVIPIVWTTIYAIFAVVLCLWASKEELPIKTIVLLAINGALNLLWCLLFFTLNSSILGVISIVLLLIASWLLIFNIFQNKRLYGYLTLIYPVWVSIATTLNLALWILN